MLKALTGLLIPILLLSGCTVTSTSQADQNNLDIGISPQARFTIQGMTEDGVLLVPEIDQETGAFESILTDHAKIHTGDSYYVQNYTTLGNGANITILIAVPATGNYHFTRAVDVEAEASVTLYGQCTVTNNGTPVTVQRRNENIVSTNELAIYTGPTITNFGNFLIRPALMNLSGNKCSLTYLLRCFWFAMLRSRSISFNPVVFLRLAVNIVVIVPGRVIETGGYRQ